MLKFLFVIMDFFLLQSYDLIILLPKKSTFIFSPQGWLSGGVHNSMVDWLCSTKIDKKFEKRKPSHREIARL